MKHNALLSFRIVLLTLCLLWGSHVVARPVEPAVALQAAQNLWQRQCATDAGQWTLVESDFSHIYVFECEGKGFVLISKDDRVHPVVGYSTTSPFTQPDSNPAFDFWMQARNSEIAYCIDHRIDPTDDIRHEWHTLLSPTPAQPRNADVAPLLVTTWSQTPYYNIHCPADTSSQHGHALTGCVATAMAQIMNYWQWPSRGQGSHGYYHQLYGLLAADFDNTRYDWAHMANFYSNQSTQRELDAVATLMYHCGVAVDMDYGPGGSSAFTESAGQQRPCAENALKNYFRYQTTLHSIQRNLPSVWLNQLKDELNAHRPVLYSAYDTATGMGHAFVCDGYDSRDYMHFNWGWNGSFDGYYALNAMNPDGYAFLNRQTAVVGIEPDYSLQLSQTTFNANPAGDMLTLLVMPVPHYPIAWQATHPTWTSLSTASGTIGNHIDTVTLTLAPNNNILTHSGTITFTQGIYTAVLHVNQPTNLPVDIDTIHYDYTDPTPLSPASGTTNELEWGIRIPSHRLKDARQVLGGMLYAVTHGNYQLRIYKSHDTANAPQQLLDSASFYIPNTYPSTLPRWTTVPLNTPLTVDTNSALWVTFHYSGFGHPALMCSGINVDGTWVKDSNQWRNFILEDTSRGRYPYNYMVRALFHVRDSLEPLYRVTAIVSTLDKGYVVGTGQYRAHSIAKLKAVPRPGYRFVRWEDGDTCPVRSVRVLGNTALTAHFATGCNQDTFFIPSVTACDQYTWNRTSITQSGIYTFIFTSSLGCDSIVGVSVTINPSNTTHFVDTNCYDYWWKGQTYTYSGEYVRTMRNEYGCDSILILHLTIYPRTLDTVAASVCDSMRWANNLLVASGRYSHTFTSSHGCDSAMVMDLTVNHSNGDSIVVDTCDRYTWDGHVYDANTSRTQKLTNRWGCDSIFTFRLTIHHNASSDEYRRAMDSYTWHDSVYTESGDYVVHLTTAWGCDSTVTLHLTIGEPGEGIGATDLPNVTIYPNPTSCTLTLQCTSPVRKVELYDMAGRKVDLPQETDTTMNLSSLPVGVYMLRVMTAESTVIKKIIKK